MIRRLLRGLGLASQGELRALESTLEATRRRLEELEAGREEAALEARVAAALQDLQAAREALASVEVKLDILEGAANVLDRRTRTGPASR